VDVNGTHFHLIKDQRDWETCRVEVESGELVSLDDDRDTEFIKPLTYDRKTENLRLSSQLPLFTSARLHSPLDVSERRGSASDSFGNWYWISNDRRRIFWQPMGARRPSVYWSQESVARCPARDVFVPVVEEQPSIAELAGLAVTEHHYLVVGNVTQGGLFLFDLHAGGEPMLLLFPGQIAFEPFDLASAAGGGVWILDRIHQTYWGLDRQFRVVSDSSHLQLIAPEEPFEFHPVGEPALIHPRREFPLGFAIAAGDPISIEALPDGSVLILDRLAPTSAIDPDGPLSQILRYRFGTQDSPALLLTDDLEVVAEGAARVKRRLNVVAYDIAFADGRLYAVEREGNQTMSFELKLDPWPTSLKLSTDFLPMYYFGSRALVSSDRKIYYDVVGGETSNDARVSWVELQVIEQPQYDREGSLHTPLLDGKERDCVWHRVFIDACIPAETAVEVWTRAHNDPELLEAVPFQREPNLYLRGAGSELPFFNAFPGREVLAERTGTWELLFQQARGRYLELKLVITGNERTTPHLHALRIYFPRFSYPKHYLPSVYLDDAESASFLERMLANQEGFFTDIEGKINDISMLFDARSAPPEDLDWLASWLGIMLDPLWAQIQQQRNDCGDLQGRKTADRRRLLIRFARKLYERRGTPSGILFALNLLLDPWLEVLLQSLKNIAVQQDTKSSLREQLAKFGLATPNSAWSEQQFEDLLYEYLLAPQRISQVRLVERYRTRGGRAGVAGDPTETNGSATATAAPDAFAHNFSVLVPEGLSPEEAAMVERITRLEKPAHAAFDVRRFWDFFRVGEARLGIDTVLGEESRFQKIVMGRSYLAEGYLHPSHPMDVAERIVADRDRLGQLPPL
jgi:phage tail-like protein